MPIYSYRCRECGERFDRFLRLTDYQLPQTCKCGGEADKLLAAPAIRGDYPGYSCPITGKWIEGRKAHEENLARHGCRVLEAGEKEQVIRRKESEEAQLDAAVERTADEFITTLPAIKRERLAAEMEGGLDVSVTRA